MSGEPRQVSVIGGAGFVGRAICDALAAAGADLTVVDRNLGAARPAEGHDLVRCDLLVDELPVLPDGPLVLALGDSDPRSPRRWTLPVSNAVATARLLPLVGERPVVLLSSIEIYGAASGVLIEDTEPVLPGLESLDDWCDRARRFAESPCPWWRTAPLGRELAAGDPTGRWVYALSKLAQEWLVRAAIPPERLTVLRLANVVGIGQDRVVTRLIRRGSLGLPLHVDRGASRSFLPASALGELVRDGIGPGTYNVGAAPVGLIEVAELVSKLTGARGEIIERDTPASDSSGLVCADALNRAGHCVAPLADYLPDLVRAITGPAATVSPEVVPVVIPPRLERPDEVVSRQQSSLANGRMKYGNSWTTALQEELAERLGLDGEHRVLAATSGTAALRLVVAAVAGPAEPGEVAVLPSFTFVATAEVLIQLGYRLRYADVDPATWTLDAAAVRDTLRDGRVKVVVAVDTFGQPCDYAALRSVCEDGGARLVSDSAAALGSRYRGRPVAGLADGHAYSMSFAKALSSGGAGGAVVLRAEACERLLASPAGWARSELMTELHAAVALDQVRILDDMIEAREQVARVYREGAALLPEAEPQQARAGDRHSYVHWVVQVPSRERVQARLLAQGVATKPYFPALHLTSHPAEHSGSEPDGNGAPLRITERLHRRALALPMSSELSEPRAEAIVYALVRAVTGP
ncbi:MAG: DegT/DnrJ/EryC1/StrS family aminotransferase [Nocardioides sp.]